MTTIDPKRPLLQWSKSFESEAWNADLPIAETWLNMRIYKEGERFHAELPFCMDLLLDSADLQGAQTEAEQDLAAALMDAALRLTTKDD